jgi:Lipopolysaccharide kinase (Kdo/WaaP) family
MTSHDGTLWQRVVLGVWRSARDAEWPDLAPDGVLGSDAGDRFHAKQGRSIVRWSLQGPSKRWVVYLKRHYHAAWWQGWLASVSPGRGCSAAWREATHLRWAAANGFPVPRVAAVGERIGPWGRLQSYLAIEELAGMIPLHEAVPAAAATLPSSTLAVWKRGLTHELARLTARLHGLRHFHKDLYFCHFYVPERFTRAIPATWAGEVHLIDLHRLGHHPFSWRWWQMKDLAQLLYSSDVIGVTARDRLRFWRAYAGPTRRGWSARLLLRVVRLRWRNYRKHNDGPNRVRPSAA